MVMIVLWLILIAVAVVFEFMTTEHLALCLAFSAAVTLILAICRVSLLIQLPVFLVLTIIAVILMRFVFNKYVFKKQ